jgi:hypothetical protein
MAPPGASAAPSRNAALILPDVPNGDHLQPDVIGQWHAQHDLAVLDARSHEREVVHEGDRADHRRPQAGLLEVLLDAALRLEVRYARVAFSATY